MLSQAAMPPYWIPLHIQTLQKHTYSLCRLAWFRAKIQVGWRCVGRMRWPHGATKPCKCWEKPFAASHSPLLPVREEVAKTVARLASQRAKDNPYFMKILPTVRSTPSWLLCTSRDTERPRMKKGAWTFLLPCGLLPK